MLNSRLPDWEGGFPYCPQESGQRTGESYYISGYNGGRQFDVTRERQVMPHPKSPN